MEGSSEAVTAAIAEDLAESTDRSFFGKRRMVPAAHGGLMTPVGTYCSGQGSFAVHFGETQAEFTLWTDRRGLVAMIDSLQAALVRADISGVSVMPPPPPLAALDGTEVPF